MKIVLTGGGTGGHIYPNIALLPKLREHFDKIIYIGEAFGMEENIAREHNLKFHGITCVKFVRSFKLDNLLIPVKLMKSIKKAKALLIREQPDVIFSKGGYVSLPVVIAGNRLGIPVVLHESDLTMGLANKIGSKFAKSLLSSFPTQLAGKKHSIFVGSPVREQILCDVPLVPFNNTKPTILVVGGSLGAGSLNEMVRAELGTITKTFNVIHLCGKGKTNREIVNPFYKQLEFSNHIGGYIKGCDYVISRGGANALFEILALKKPALIVPLSREVSRGDQIENAQFLSNLDLCQLHDDSISLSKNIELLVANKHKITTAISHSELSDGKSRIVEEIVKSIIIVPKEVILSAK